MKKILLVTFSLIAVLFTADAQIAETNGIGYDTVLLPSGDQPNVLLGQLVFTPSATISNQYTTDVALIFKAPDDAANAILFQNNGVTTWGWTLYQDGFNFVHGPTEKVVLSISTNGVVSAPAISTPDLAVDTVWVRDGSNKQMGVATLSSGSTVVYNTRVTAQSRIFLTPQTSGGVPGEVSISARTAGYSFTITSSSPLDTRSVAWWIIEPN